MNVLLIDPLSCFLDFALRCEAFGHAVRIAMGPHEPGVRSTVGDGLLHKVENWRSHIKWADIIVCSDNCRYAKEIGTLQRAGFPVIGTSDEMAKWELDRAVGQQVLMDAGIATLPTIPFKSFSDAQAFVQRNSDKRYVSKPMGDVDKSLSYVSHDAADLSFMLARWAKQPKVKPDFILQEFVAGIEVAVGGWVGPQGFEPHFLENFEFKKLMPGDAGCNTGEMGTVMRYATEIESELAQKLLMPLEPELIRQGYTGYIDVACIVDKKGNPWPLEFTTRMGWPLLNIQQALHPEPVEWMASMLQGRSTFEPWDGVAIGVILAIPDFPYHRKSYEELQGFPLWGLTEKNRNHFHPCDLKAGMVQCVVNGKLQQRPAFVSAGDYLGVVSASGTGIEDAQKRVYKTVKELHTTDGFLYRNDIGNRLKEQLPELQRHGYATAWSW